jgi:hypothetical protein
MGVLAQIAKEGQLTEEIETQLLAIATDWKKF